MAVSHITLTAGCFVQQGIRVMQIAGRLTDQGFDACYYLAFGRNREIIETQNYSIDASTKKEYVFNDQPGVPVVISIHQDIHRKGSETVLIINADTGEVVAANEDGHVPPLVNERDPSATKRMNKFFGRDAFVAISRNKAWKVRKSIPAFPIKKTEPVPVQAAEPPTKGAGKKRKRRKKGKDSLSVGLESSIEALRLASARKEEAKAKTFTRMAKTDAVRHSCTLSE